MADETVFKKFTQTPPQPPRMTGVSNVDQRALVEWQWGFYNSTVIESGLLDPVYQQVVGEISFDSLPDPQATTIARAQATANAAWEAGEQFKVDLEADMKKFAFGGQFTISDFSSSAAVGFTNDIGTTSYFVTVTPVAASGAPANDAFRIIAVSKGSGGIGVSVAGAPGLGSNVTYDYHVIGHFPSLTDADEED